jgi:dipeptidyl-peptidase-4
LGEKEINTYCKQDITFDIDKHNAMRYTFCLILAVSVITPSFAQLGKKQITLEDLYKNYTFKLKDVPGFNAMKDGKHYTQLNKEGGSQSIDVYELATGEKVKNVYTQQTTKMKTSPPSTDVFTIDAYQFSKDEKQVMMFSESQNIYRRSVLNTVYIYNTVNQGTKLLDNGKVLHATFSPDGTKVAFVKNNNLYYKDLVTDQVTQVTTDGEKNKVINGNCDWVYEEEFGFSRAYEWSYDGKYLAYYRFDESLVPEYSMAKYTGLYPEQYTYKYPKAGERNSVVQIKIYNVDKKQTVDADLGKETDQYIPRIKWIDDANRLCVYRMNRLQNNLELMLTNPTNGKAQIIYKEHNKCYIEINDQITFCLTGIL